MKLALILLAVFLMSNDRLDMPGLSPAYLRETLDLTQTNDDEVYDEHGNATRVSDTGEAASCHAQEPAIPQRELCNGSSSSVDADAFHYFRNLLSGGRNETLTLCGIDALLVRSERDCIGARSTLIFLQSLCGCWHMSGNNTACWIAPINGMRERPRYWTMQAKKVS
jgi:hypothetical protein